MANKTFETGRVAAEPHAVGLGAWAGRVLDAVDHRAHVFYNVPSVAVLVLLYVVPVLVTIYLALHYWPLSRIRPPVWVGLSNFVRLFQAERFRGAVVHTFTYTGLAVSLELVLGMVMALILNQRFRGRSVVRTVFLFSMMATPIAAMMAWRLLLDPFTGIFSLIKSLGGPRIFPPLASRTWVIPTLVVVDVWEWTPLVGLILLGGLSALPREPYEAASIDGASGWQQFWYITVPLLRPVMVVALLFRTIDALKAFETVFVITGGGPAFASETLNVYAYKEAFQNFHTGYGSALLLVYFFIIMFFAVILIRVRRVSS